jgi:hypothetical protein
MVESRWQPICWAVGPMNFGERVCASPHLEASVQAIIDLDQIHSNAG